MSAWIEERERGLSRRDALQEAVSLRRDELKRAVQDLEQVVKGRVDVGRHVAEKPWLWMGGAFGLGLWLGVRRMWTD